MDSDQSRIEVGTKGEKYGSWMSNIVLYAIGGITVLAAVLALLSFVWLDHMVLGIVLAVIAAVAIAVFAWCIWICRQYAFGGGGVMDRSHRVVLSHLDFDGRGTLLEVGCGSGPLAIRAAKTWPEAKVIGIDYYGPSFGYTREVCDANARKAGVSDRCEFRQGDARKLDLEDGSVDAVVSNFVYHNVVGSDIQELLLETLRVLRKGGVFALNDAMSPKAYGDMDAFVAKLREMGFEDVRLVDTETEIFGSHGRAKALMLGDARMLVGRK